MLAFLDGEDYLFELIPSDILFFYKGDSGTLASAGRVVKIPSLPDLAAGIVEKIDFRLIFV